MFTQKQYEKDTQEFLDSFKPIVGKSEVELLALLQEKKVWERYGNQPWAIYNRRRPGKTVDVKRLVKLQAKGLLFTRTKGV